MSHYKDYGIFKYQITNVLDDPVFAMAFCRKCGGRGGIHYAVSATIPRNPLEPTYDYSSFKHNYFIYCFCSDCVSSIGEVDELARMYLDYEAL